VDVQAWRHDVLSPAGGVRMLDALDVDVKKYHLNEGHASLLTIELLRKSKRYIEKVWDERLQWDDEFVRERCVFTTHTPVAAGHDKFGYDVV